MPFDDNDKLTNFAIVDKPFKASSKMNLDEFTWVEHSNKIRTERVDGSGNAQVNCNLRSNDFGFSLRCLGLI